MWTDIERISNLMQNHCIDWRPKAIYLTVSKKNAQFHTQTQRHVVV